MHRIAASLKTKLLLPLAAAYLIAVGVLGYFLLKGIEEQSETVIRQSLEKSAVTMAAGLMGWIESQKEVVDILSKAPSIKDIARKPYDYNLYFEAEKFLNSIYRDHRDLYENIVFVYKPSKRGEIIKSINNRLYRIKEATALIDTVGAATVGKGGYDLEFLKKALIEGKATLSSPYPSIYRKNPIIVVISPVKIEGKVLGAVLVAVKLDFFAKKMQNNSLIKTVVLDEKNRVIISENIQTDFLKASKEILGTKAQDGFWQTDKKALFSKELENGWRIVSYADKEILMEPFFKKRGQLLAVIIVLTGIVLLFYMRVINKSILHPLRKLSAIMSDFSPNKQLPQERALSESSVEIAHIFDSFKNLADQLNQSYATLTKNMDLLDEVINVSPDPIAYKNRELKYIGCNDAFAKFTGLNKDNIIGKRASEIFSENFASILEENDKIAIKTKQRRSIKGWYKVGEQQRYLHILFAPISDLNKEIYTVVNYINDLTNMEKAREKIAYQAMHDALTGLPNRALLTDRLQNAIKEAKREKQKVALLFLDLDHFKLINDTLGHHVGDKLLIQVAGRIKEALRESDTVSRIGGDEFLIIAKNVHNYTDAYKIANKILKKIEGYYHIDSAQLYISGSIGISIYPDDSQEAGTLIKYADIAMYHAKDLGRNNVQLYSKELSDKIDDEHTLESSLKKGLEKGEFILHFQPQIETKTKKIVGVEALIRWNHPKMGMLYPDKFIKIAENTGLIIPMGRWVIKEAAKAARLWRDLGFDLRVSVNISMRQFQHDDLLKSLKELKKEGALLESLDLEITETIYAYNIEKHAKVMRRIKEMGPTLSIDDFGTEYSSLKLLKVLPIDRVKIDKSFVIESVNDKEAVSIVKAIVAMCRELGLKTVAEGVESAEHLKLLEEIGCDYSQGFYIGRPTTFEEITKTIKENHENRLS